MVFVNKAATDRGHTSIRGAHFALGLLEMDRQSGAGLFEKLDLDRDDLRAALEAEAEGQEEKQAKLPPGGSPPFSPTAKKALGMSLREALQLGTHWIGPGHMLLGVLSAAASSVLVERLELDRAREVVGAWERDKRASDQAAGRERNGTVAKGFSEVVKAAMTKETKPIGSHHLLLVMFEVENTLARKVLSELGVTEKKVQELIESIGTEGTIDEPPLQEDEVRVGDQVIRIADADSRAAIREVLGDQGIAARIRDALARRKKDGDN
jgi:ATP-dependent Clp protease ATP-binding subunit ClpA